nr:MAG TPA: hypothetical protein [Caudoviricetes sp.]
MYSERGFRYGGENLFFEVFFYVYIGVEHKCALVPFILNRAAARPRKGEFVRQRLDIV